MASSRQPRAVRGSSQVNSQNSNMSCCLPSSNQSKIPRNSTASVWGALAGGLQRPGEVTPGINAQMPKRSNRRTIRTLLRGRPETRQHKVFSAFRTVQLAANGHRAEIFLACELTPFTGRNLFLYPTFKNRQRILEPGVDFPEVLEENEIVGIREIFCVLLADYQFEVERGC